MLFSNYSNYTFPTHGHCLQEKQKTQSNILCMYFKICIKSHLPRLADFWVFLGAYDFQLMGKVTPHMWIAENQQLTVTGSQDEKLMDWWNPFSSLHSFTAVEKKNIRYIIPWRGSKKKERTLLSYIDFFLLSSAYQAMTHLKHQMNNRR